MTTTSSDVGDAVAIRQAEMADLLAVFRIEQASFDQPWPFSAFEHYLDTPGFLVAEYPDETASPGDSGPVVGYVVGDIVPNHGRAIGHIKDLAVHPDCRGRGLGAALLDRALGVLDAHDAARVKLEVRESNDAARSLYRRFGFEYRHTVPRYYGDGEDALVMVLDTRGRP